MRGKDIQAEIMATIVAELENGVLPWAPPWHSEGNVAGIPFNYQTRRPYSRGNVLLLWTAMKHHGFVSPAFVTYRQAREAGGHVLKGETGLSLVYWNPTGRCKNEGEEERRLPVLRRFRVFNVAQTNLEGADQVRPETLDLSCAEILRTHEVDVRVGGHRAYYSGAGDFIRMPPRSSFESRQAYEAVLLHETIHWTGHASRCGREQPSRENREGYAREELTAEIGSAFLSARLGLPYRPTHASYIDHWLNLLRSDTRELFRAARQADRAVRFLEAPLRQRGLVTDVEQSHDRSRTARTVER